jgi:hypothetical protein
MIEVVDWQKIERDYYSGILAEKRVKAGLRAEELREKLDPESAVIGLLELGHQAKSCDIEDLARLKFQAEILTTILRKCMPDLRTLEIKEKSSSATTLVIDMLSSS